MAYKSLLLALLSSIYIVNGMIGSEELIFGPTNSQELGIQNPVKTYSVFERWNGHEEKACKSLVGSLVYYKVIECFLENSRLLGKFNGITKRATTFFEDGYDLEYSYEDFTRALFIQEKKDADVSEILVILDNQLYDLEGKRMIAGYEKRFARKEDLIKNKKRCVIS